VISRWIKTSAVEDRSCFLLNARFLQMTSVVLKRFCIGLYIFETCN
jgi:hypothetical protein